jgi:hypothetical protein
MSQSMAQSMASGNLASVQQSLSTFFAGVQGDLAKVESAASSAPANVQAALKVINNEYGTLKTTIDSATSLTQLGSSMAALGNDAQLKAASATLDAYYNGQCGTTTTAG